MQPYHVYARLGRADDRLPWNGRLFGHGTDHPGYEVVDKRQTFVLRLIADGSIVEETPPGLAPAPAPHPDP